MTRFEPRPLLPSLVEAKKVQKKTTMPHRGCQLCSLGKRNLQVFEPDGSWNARVVFVGEAPGKDEEEQQKVFVGRTGKLLRGVLSDLKIRDYFLTNTCCCRHLERAPNVREIRTCFPLLQKRLERVNPELVVLLGNTPLRSIWDASGITGMRGKFVQDRGRWVFATFHPAAVLRNPDLSEVFLADMGLVKDFLNGKPPKRVPIDYSVVTNLEEFGELISHLREKGRFSLDLETSTLRPYAEGAKIVVATFATAPGKAYLVPLEHKESPFSRGDLDGEVYPRLREIFEDESLKKIFQNGKFDIGYLEYHLGGLRFKGFSFDTMLAHYLLDERKGHGLHRLSWKDTDMAGYDLEMTRYVGSHKEANPKKGGSYANVPLKILARYGMGDADATLRLVEEYSPRLETEGLSDVLQEILIPSAYVLSKIEKNGIKVDVERAKVLALEYEKELKKIVARIHSEVPEVSLMEEVTGEPFNFDSPDQLQFLLFELLKLPVIKRSEKTKQPSTDKEVLIALQGKHPIISELQSYRSRSKLRSSFLSPAENWLAEDGRAHPTYLLIGTVTGRLACVGPPNLQQIPRESTIKDIFVAEEGWFFLEMDYSQIELRVMAMLSGDEKLLSAFRGGVEDIHRVVAAEIFGVSEEEVTEEQRYKVKGINFGLIYGRSSESIAQEYGMTKQEALDFREEYFSKYAGVRRYIESVKREVQKLGYVRNAFGRKRRLPFARSRNRGKQEEAFRMAVNAPIQSLASDITLLTMVLVDEFLEQRRMRTKIITEVHDSLLFETLEDEGEDLVKIIRGVVDNLPLPEMEDISLVPLVVNLKVGRSWGSLKKVV